MVNVSPLQYIRLMPAVVSFSNTALLAERMPAVGSSFPSACLLGAQQCIPFAPTIGRSLQHCIAPPGRMRRRVGLSVRWRPANRWACSPVFNSLASSTAPLGASTYRATAASILLAPPVCSLAASERSGLRERGNCIVSVVKVAPELHRFARQPHVRGLVPGRPSSGGRRASGLPPRLWAIGKRWGFSHQHRANPSFKRTATGVPASAA